MNTATIAPPTKKFWSRTGDFLASGTVYGDLDEAMQAASCLCGLHPEGATIYAVPSRAQPDSEEGYQVVCKAVRADGSTWPLPTVPHEPVYRVIHASYLR